MRVSSAFCELAGRTWQLTRSEQRCRAPADGIERPVHQVEGLISRLQPLVPHYDALIAAERAIDESRIELDALAGTRSEEREGFAPEHMRSEHAESSGGEQGGSEPGEYVGGEHGGGEQPAAEQTESVWGN